MKAVLLSLVAFATLAFAAASGSFRGQVVNGPNQGSSADTKWVFVQAPNGSVRRVETSHARIHFGSGVAPKQNKQKPADAVREGAEVRVTASQDGDGEWKATDIEILKLAPH